MCDLFYIFQKFQNQIMTLNNFNKKDRTAAKQDLLQCCHSSEWADLLMEHFPFSSEMELVEQATRIWYEECGESDWREAFAGHPKIGEVKSLRAKFASTQHFAGEEQSGVKSASMETIEALAQANADYEAKNSFIFIICATGKSADEMLRLLQDRLKNTPKEELHIAMGEQHKITLIRLQKLLQDADWSGLKVSQLTTHVLDTSIGKPGQNLTIKLQAYRDIRWQTIAQSVTNSDGRIADLLPPNRVLSPDNYQMVFETAAYFQEQNVKGFYPVVEIQFSIFDDNHYHIPLLLNPFGYSTYRGS